MKQTVTVYLTNGSVSRYSVVCPEVCNLNSYTIDREVAVFSHLGYRNGDTIEEHFEEVETYNSNNVVAIYVDKECRWYNPKYIREDAKSTFEIMKSY